ncbi:ABC transporter substrate-binding protein [Glaciecola sp. KUL10]|uniref:ABC transporter substrate-binding protein n=1 Tax=Glaciecola sp. (strain KUL10) TaxID=2161813 RepID=UPI000D7888DD|nr:ABC transporter substrate-binding protein [Glaciecola sp. KUL10]GBL03370.1 extracellular ligand-binding receptor [Glaciecola sp. KUL10]
MNAKILALLFLFCSVISVHASQLTIVLDADFSGGAKNGGIAIKRGVELAVVDINENGGLLGKQLQLVVTDHRGNPARGVANLKKQLKDESVIAVIGGVHTPVVLAQLPLVKQTGLPFLIPWAAGTTIVENGFENNNVFRVSLRDSDAAITMLNHAKNQGYKNVSLILERTGWGRSNEVSMKRYASSLGISVDEVLWFNWRQSTYESLIEQIEMKPQKALILVANAPEGAEFLLSLLNNNEKRVMPVLSHWGITAGDFVSLVGLEKLGQMQLSILQSFHFAKTDMQDNAQTLLSKYRAKYDTQANESNITAAVGVAQGYDIVQLLAESIRNTKSYMAPLILDGLENLESYQGVVKHYQRPFSAGKHDALLADDYLMTRFNEDGHLVPVSNE